mgnify:FL=1
MTTTPWIGPNGKRMRRLELHLTYTCPERCVFCSEAHRMATYKAFPVTWGRVAKVLRQHAERGVTNVHFTGGEPTIHPRFVDILKLARKLGMRTSIGSIGTMMSREPFARDALPWLDEALFSLHGPDASIHDALTRRPGSFETVTSAMKMVRRLKPEFGLFANVVMTRGSLDTLPDTVALAAELGAKLIIVSNTTPEGEALDRYEELAPRLEDLARVLPTVPAVAGDAVLRFFGVPMCLLGEHSMISNDLHWDARVTVEWTTQPGKVVFDGIYNWEPNRKRVHVEACSGCTLSGVCMGVYDRYAELWPTTALSPVRRESA